MFVELAVRVVNSGQEFEPVLINTDHIVHVHGWEEHSYIVLTTTIEYICDLNYEQVKKLLTWTGQVQKTPRFEQVAEEIDAD